MLQQHHEMGHHSLLSYIYFVTVYIKLHLTLKLFLCKSKLLLHLKGIEVELHSVWVIGQLLLEKDLLLLTEEASDRTPQTM
jgi:hypothetical protein